jgi:hypothetical protein
MSDIYLNRASIGFEGFQPLTKLRNNVAKFGVIMAESNLPTNKHPLTNDNDS